MADSGASGSGQSVAGSANAGAAAAGAPHAGEAAAGASAAGAPSGEGGTAGIAGGGVFGVAGYPHACDGSGGGQSIGSLAEKPPISIKRKMGSNLPFEQFQPAGGSYGLRSEDANGTTVMRFTDSFVNYDLGGYVYRELQLSMVPMLGQSLPMDPGTTDNLHFQVGLNKAWDPAPGQTIEVRGIERYEGNCATRIAFRLTRLKMQPSSVDGNEAQGTFEFDGVLVVSINDYD